MVLSLFLSIRKETETSSKVEFVKQGSVGVVVVVVILRLAGSNTNNLMALSIDGLFLAAIQGHHFHFDGSLLLVLGGLVFLVLVIISLFLGPSGRLGGW